MLRHDSTTSLGKLLRSFFLQHLKIERRLSDNTIASYACSFRLLLAFCTARRGQRARALDIADIDAPIVLAFLRHLEIERGCGIATRNARLAAVKSFFKYVGVHEAQALAIAQRVRAIPEKRCDKRLVGYLTPDEMKAVLGAPDRSRWSGRRDHALFVMAYVTGARVSELLSLLRTDVDLRSALGMVKFHGKGRKERTAVLPQDATRTLKAWERELAPSTRVLFPNRRGEMMTRSAARGRLLLAVRHASSRCPSLQGRVVSPHQIRHTTAMHLLNGGTSLPEIALYLGHESLQSTHCYTQADVEMKRRTLAALPPIVSRRRGGPRELEADLEFLEKLQRLGPTTEYSDRTGATTRALPSWESSGER